MTNPDDKDDLRRRAGIRRVVWIGALIAVALYIMIIARGVLSS